MKGQDAKTWEKQVSGSGSGMQDKDVKSTMARIEQWSGVDAMSSLTLGSLLPQHLAEANPDFLLYTVVGQLGDIYILRKSMMDISFHLVDFTSGKGVMLTEFMWNLNYFRSKIGCVIPHPGEMDFIVRVSCEQNYAVILGPPTSQSKCPETKLLNKKPPMITDVTWQYESKPAWPVNVEFHPSNDSVLAALLYTESTFHTPWPKFCYSPVHLALIDVRGRVLSVLQAPPTLSPQLLSFTADGSEVIVLSEMQVKSYAVESVEKGNKSNILLVSCDMTKSDVIEHTPTEKLSLDVSAATASPAKVVAEIPAPELVAWQHQETSDHVHKSTYTWAVTSMDRQVIHIANFSTLHNKDTQIFTYNRTSGK